MDDTEKSKATVSKMKATASTSQPSFMDMVLEAIKANEEKKGASVPFIRNYIAETYRTVDPNMMKFRLRKALDKGLDNGNIIRPKNSEEAKGMTGRFKLNKIKEPKKEKKSIPEAKEKVAKKKTKKEETKAIKEKSTKKVTSIEAPEKKPKKTSAKDAESPKAKSKTKVAATKATPKKALTKKATQKKVTMKSPKSKKTKS